MARMIRRNAKKDIVNVSFSAISKHYVTTTQELDACALCAKTTQIWTDQSAEYTKRIKHLQTKTYTLSTLYHLLMSLSHWVILIEFIFSQLYNLQGMHQRPKQL